MVADSAKKTRRLPWVLPSKRQVYRGYDSRDSIAYRVQDDAIEARTWSKEGVLECVDHPAAYDDEAFDDCVIDPSLIDLLALRKEVGAEALLEAVRPELEQRLVRKGGKQQRAYYTLVRCFGPESPYALAGLNAGPAAEAGVLQALDNPVFEDTDDPADSQRCREPYLVAQAGMFGSLPNSLLPGLAPLLDERSLTKRGHRDTSDAARVVRVLLRIESDEVALLLLRAVESEQVRPALVEALAKDATARAPSALPAAVRARFEAAAEGIERSRVVGLPSRVDMAVAGAIAAIAGRDRELARRTMTFFDLVPGPAGTAAPVALLARLLAASVDLLETPDLARLAAFMSRPPAERLPAAAAAWVRLDAPEAAKVASTFKVGDRATVDARWTAAARAQLGFVGRQLAITALIPPEAFGAELASAPADMALPLLEGLIRRARTSEELHRAATLAAARAEARVLPAVLEKLREVPFKVDPTFEATLGTLIQSDQEDMIQDEIGGENPFRDRCAALERALESARRRRARSPAGGGSR